MPTHLDACLDHLREGDVLTVWKLDRLGRNTQHVLAVVAIAAFAPCVGVVAADRTCLTAAEPGR